MEKAMIRVRISAGEAHYGGNLVDGAHMLQLFGDVATELLIDMMATKVCLQDMKKLNSLLRYMQETILKLPEKLLKWAIHLEK